MRLVHKLDTSSLRLAFKTHKPLSIYTATA